MILDVEVLPDGRAGTVTIVEDGGFSRLCDAASESARRGHFRPATFDGTPVPSVIRLPFRFVLE